VFGPLVAVRHKGQTERVKRSENFVHPQSPLGEMMKYEFKGLEIAFPGFGPSTGHQWAEVTITKTCREPEVGGSLKVNVLVPDNRALSLGELERAAFDEAKEAIRQILVMLEVDTADRLREKQRERETADQAA